MKKFTGFMIFSLVLCAALCINSAGTEAVSPGIEVIRGETRLLKCCVNGQRVGFTTEEFERLTGVEFSYLTLCSLPDLKDGVLKFAGVDAVRGQRISPSGLSLLSFVPSSGFKGSGGFTFTVAAEGWESREISCLIRFSETVNFAPIAVSSEFRTYEDVSVTKKLPTYDPDGDALSYVVELYPSNGTLEIDEGKATYTPSEGFTGADSFTYHAEDGYGNKSVSAKADIIVRKSGSGIYFADMQEDSAHLDAILAAENDIMTYTLIGDSYYFTPDEKVSRIDFAVMLVSAAGVEVPEKKYPTDIFVDTAEQSRGKRLCLEAAVTNGFIKADSASFRPDEGISIADAASMTENALSKTAKGIGCAYFGDETRCLTKKDAARMLAAFAENQ